MHSDQRVDQLESLAAEHDFQPDTRDHLVLIDGHALIYRAYHAFPGLTAGNGELVNAVYGFSRILLTAIQDLSPTYLAVTFDSKGPTKRADSFAAYKAHRPEMPEDLKPQIERVKAVVEAMNIPQFAVAGYEADDLLGTVTTQVAAEQVVRMGSCDELLSIIVTGDKDLFQLVDSCTHVWLPGRGKGQVDMQYDADGVFQKMGVTPSQVVELKALMGDSSDNIPGVKGVGKKTAEKLVATFGTIDALYERVESLVASGEKDELLKGALLTKLITDKELAFVSRELATIDRQAPIEFDLERCRVTDYDKHAVTALFEELDFHSLLRLLPKDDFELGIQDALW
jgi:DNA polymerase-1